MTGSAASAGPRLSAILVTPDRCERLRWTLDALRRQSAASEIEIVLVVPSARVAEVDEERLAGFYGWQLVETGPTRSSTFARAAGVRAARAPVVAFTEDHCFPEPGWARALIDAHREPWAAVGPVFLNANPESRTSWVNLLVEYGSWVEPADAGPRDHIPGHNSSYKRELLLQYGDRLPEMLEAETVLQWDLRARGHRLRLEPAARTSHFNVSLAIPTIGLRFAVGRMFGAARARDWPFRKRAAYVAAAPLIPIVRFSRLAPIVHRQTRERSCPRGLLPALLAGLVVDGFGELLGYALGGGDSVARVTAFEHDRERYMRRGDRAAFGSAER